MSEKLNHHEHGHASHEKLVSQEHQEHAEKQQHHAAEQAKKERAELNLAKLREAAKDEAKTKAHTNQDEQLKDEPDTSIGTQQSLKSHAYKQSLNRIQRHLNTPQRALSKIVHAKGVDTISNIGASTVARPSGLLGGSICAFLGSLVLLYSAKHYGFRYNYFVFFMLFVGGFLLGVTLELLIWVFYGRKRRF